MLSLTNLHTRAEAATGDWPGDDPSCYLTEDEIAVRKIPHTPVAHSAIASL